MQVWIVLVVVISPVNWAMCHTGRDEYSILGQTFLFFALADFVSSVHPWKAHAKKAGWIVKHQQKLAWNWWNWPSPTFTHIHNVGSLEMTIQSTLFGLHLLQPQGLIFAELLRVDHPYTSSRTGKTGHHTRQFCLHQDIKDICLV